VGAQPPRSQLTGEELAYYRAVEDLFARLRGTPFLLTPKDFALLRRWWQEAVPLAAVAAGVAEVFERNRERDGDPVSSLAYCRHAVQRHARRLAAAAAGTERAPAAVDVAGALRRLVAEVRATADRRQGEAAVAAALGSLAATLESVPASAAPAAVDELLGRLELMMVEALCDALTPADRAAVESRVAGGLAGVDLETEIRARTERALRLRAVRELLGLPRLELTPQ
jgi:hypothetical protein